MAKRIRSAVLLVVVVSMLLGLAISPASAHWGTSRHIHVYLKSDNWLSYTIPIWNPHINACTIYVYGPSGYYKQQYYAGWNNAASFGKTVDFVFDKAPTGSYRIRVKWYAGNDSNAQEANQYGTLSWAERADAYTFKSP